MSSNRWLEEWPKRFEIFLFVRGEDFVALGGDEREIQCK